MKNVLWILPLMVLGMGCAGSGVSSPRRTSSEPPPSAAPVASEPVIYDAPAGAGAYTVSETVTAEPAALGGAAEYVVKAGDTLWKIAREQGTTVARIREANGLTGDVIRPGQLLKIPR